MPLPDPEVASLIAARRAELDILEEQLVGQLAEVRGERYELAVAEKVWARFGAHGADAAASSVSAHAQVAGRAVLLVAHRAAGMKETTLPADYQRLLSIVRSAGGLVATRQVGAVLGMDTEARGSLEPSRGKLDKPADWGWLRKPLGLAARTAADSDLVYRAAADVPGGNG